MRLTPWAVRVGPPAFAEQPNVKAFIDWLLETTAAEAASEDTAQAEQTAG